MVKYPFWVQKIITLYDTTWGNRRIQFRQMSISPGQTNTCKTAFSLHVVESVGDDYSF